MSAFRPYQLLAIDEAAKIATFRVIIPPFAPKDPAKKASRIINGFGNKSNERRPDYRTIRRAMRYFREMGHRDVFRYTDLRKTLLLLGMPASSIPYDFRIGHAMPSRRRTVKSVSNELRDCVEALRGRV